MMKIGEQFQTADWKSEKHVPVIDCPDQVQSNEMFDVTGTLYAAAFCNIHGLWENSKGVNHDF